MTRTVHHLFVAGHNLLLAHAKAWHVYDTEFRDLQKGRISIVLNSDWFFPEKNEEGFFNATERGIAWNLGWFANPIFVDGDYPQVMKTLIARNSKAEGIPSRYKKPFPCRHELYVLVRYHAYGRRNYT